MKRYQKIASAILFCFFLTACIKGGFDLDDCKKRLRLEFEWINTNPSDGLEAVEVIFTSTEGESIHFQALPEGEEIQIEEGLYNITVWEPVENISIEKNIVNLKVNTDGTWDIPVNFNGGATQKLIDDTQTVIIAPLMQQTRPLCIRIAFRGIYAGWVTGVKGVVNGIASSRHINEGFIPVDPQITRPAPLGEPVRKSYDLKLNEENWYTDMHNLLGIHCDDNQPQTLTLTISFIDGTEQVLVYDVTEDLEEFHITEVAYPWVIEIIFNMGITIDIEEWISEPYIYLTLN